MTDEALKTKIEAAPLWAVLLLFIGSAIFYIASTCLVGYVVLSFWFNLRDDTLVWCGENKGKVSISMIGYATCYDLNYQGYKKEKGEK